MLWGDGRELIVSQRLHERPMQGELMFELVFGFRWRLVLQVLRGRIREDDLVNADIDVADDPEILVAAAFAPPPPHCPVLGIAPRPVRQQDVARAGRLRRGVEAVPVERRSAVRVRHPYVNNRPFVDISQAAPSQPGGLACGRSSKLPVARQGRRVSLAHTDRGEGPVSL